MAEFARLESAGTYPKRNYDGSENQSYGFTPAYKVQTGDSRGELTIKGLIRIVNSDGVVLLIMGFKRETF